MIDKTTVSENENVSTSKDALVQMNIRVKKSVAQSFRYFCEERNITQSEGLRLLLMGEDFAKRDAIMQVYQEEMLAKRDEINRLKEHNKELLELQRGKESWALHQRKEWIRITKTVLDFVINRIVMPRYDYDKEIKPRSFKSHSGKRLFRSYPYPTECGCYEVYVSDLVWGKQNHKKHPEQSAALFICGEMADGTPRKFRWYDKKEFIGIRPNEKIFSSAENPWLLSCIISRDGAADLVCAVPLRQFGQPKHSLLDVDCDLMLDENVDAAVPMPQKEGKKSSLDSMIANASRKQFL